MAVELVGPRRALEVVPRDLRLPYCDRLRVAVVVVVGVGCLGLSLAQRCRAAEAHLFHVLKGHRQTSPLKKGESSPGGDLVVSEHTHSSLGPCSWCK